MFVKAQQFRAFPAIVLLVCDIPARRASTRRSTRWASAGLSTRRASTRRSTKLSASGVAAATGCTSAARRPSRPASATRRASWLASAARLASGARWRLFRVGECHGEDCRGNGRWRSAIRKREGTATPDVRVESLGPAYKPASRTPAACGRHKRRMDLVS
jgi:hypothetical protein